MNTDYKFKEIDKYMKEYWKTHKIILPDKDTPSYIIGKIIEENLTNGRKKYYNYS